MNKIEKIGLAGIGLTIISFVKTDHSTLSLILLAGALLSFAFMLFKSKIRV